MNKKIFFIFAFLFIFSFAFVSAQPPFQTSTGTEVGLTLRTPVVGTLKVNETVTSHMHVFNQTNDLPIVDNATTNCTVHLYNKIGDHLIQSQMGFDNNLMEWQLEIGGGNFSEVGMYAFIVWCQTDDAGGFSSGGFDVTINGMSADYPYLIASLLLILVFIGFGFLIYKDKDRIDDEKFWNKMVSRWKDKNYLKFSAIAVWYNLRKNSYILQYLIGFVIMIIVYDITLIYNLSSIGAIFKVILSLYTWGSAIVTLVLFGNVQEWIMQWKKDIEDINWGMSNVK